jgi:hypothetical protein
MEDSLVFFSYGIRTIKIEYHGRKAGKEAEVVGV